MLYKYFVKGNLKQKSIEEKENNFKKLFSFPVADASHCLAYI